MRPTFTFRLPEPLKVELKKTAEKQGVTMNAMLLNILWEWVARKRIEDMERSDRLAMNAFKEKIGQESEA